MKSLNDFLGQDLDWVQSHRLRSAYELRAGDELLAHLYWRGVFRSRVHVETADESWVIEQRGLRRTITVLTGDTHTKSATIKRGISGQATLHFPDGHMYTWQCTSFWRGVWTWLNQEGTPLLHQKRGTQVHLEPAARGISDLALITTLGWYLHRQQEEEAGAVTPIVPSTG
jgi:hypothetical protein